MEREQKKVMKRREFLEIGTVSAASLAFSSKIALGDSDHRVLRLYDTHSQRTVEAEYFRNGWYNPDILARFDDLMKDWRTGETARMDPNLLDILYKLQQIAGSREPIHVVCAYRSPGTNAALAARNSRVARNSYHVTGKACDIRLPGYSVRGLRDHALALEAGGVGYYPRSGFIHVDTGPLRAW